jgi:hypothetical protein
MEHVRSLVLKNEACDYIPHPVDVLLIWHRWILNIFRVLLARSIFCFLKQREGKV